VRVVQEVFRALSDETRRNILAMLRDGDLTAGQIAGEFDISKPSISHHLNILKAADLVSAERRGQEIVYSLNTTVFQDVMSYMLEMFGERTPQ
jgi:DNA-binding transcriptional ArsR family regulator